MVIVQDVSDDEQSAYRPESEVRHRIPLTHPSSLDAQGSKPLLSPSLLSGSESVLSENVQSEDTSDAIFEALLLIVPFTFLFILLDILVHLQYQHRATLSRVITDLSRAVPTLSLLVFYSQSSIINLPDRLPVLQLIISLLTMPCVPSTARPAQTANRHFTHPFTVPFLLSASILSGCRLIWLVNYAGWSLTTDQAPAVGTLWILTIVQLPLSRAVIALIAVAGWSWYSGMKVMP